MNTKHISIFSAFLFFSILLFSFTLSSLEQNDKIIKKPDVMPTYGDCLELEGEAKKKCSDMNIIQHISKHITYPEEARKKGIEGIAVIRSIVEKDGSVSFPEQIEDLILRDPGHGTAQEAVKAIQSMDKWNPGIHEGKMVRVEFIIPVKFKLSDEKSKGPSNKKKPCDSEK